MYARGLSTRDIEACFKDEEGRSLLPRSVVSEVSERLWAEYEAFATRDLTNVRPLYLFLDGVAERLWPAQAREAVLCAWAITWEGKKVLIHLAPGTKESTECCREFLKGDAPPGALRSGAHLHRRRPRSHPGARGVLSRFA